jgi:hypothetical protein
VYLKVSPIRGLRRFKVKGKLSPHYIGPLKILERKDEVAYQLELPAQLFLLYVAEGISSLNLREKRMIPELNFNPCKVNLTHTLGTSKDRSEATVSLIFRVMDQGHHKRLQDRMHTNCARRTSVARLHDRTPVCYAEHTLTRRCMCTTNQYIEWWE